MPRGTGKRTPRNLIYRLPRAFKSVAIQAMLDGCTAAEVIERVREAGCPENRMPSESSVSTYRDTAEWERAQSDWMRGQVMAEQYQAMADAIAAGEGIESAADVGLAMALTDLVQRVQAGDMETGQLVDVARAFGGAKRTALAEQESRIRQDVARRKTQADTEVDKVGEAEGLTPETIGRIKQIYGIVQ